MARKTPIKQSKKINVKRYCGNSTTRFYSQEIKDFVRACVESGEGYTGSDVYRGLLVYIKENKIKNNKLLTLAGICKLWEYIKNERKQ